MKECNTALFMTSHIVHTERPFLMQMKNDTTHVRTMFNPMNVWRPFNGTKANRIDLDVKPQNAAPHPGLFCLLTMIFIGK